MQLGARTGRFRIGDAVFDADEGALWRDGRRVNLTPRLAAILERLTRDAPHTVAKQDLMDSVWTDSIVSESALTQRVKELRALLGDDARSPRFIETVSRRGYRFVAPVTRLDGGKADEADALGQADAGATGSGGSDAASSRLVEEGRAPGLLAAAFVALATLGAAGTLMWLGAARRTTAPSPTTPSPRRSVAVLGFRSLAPAHEGEWLGMALPEMLTTELAAGQRLRLVPGEAVRHVRSDLGIDDGESLAPETLRRVGQSLGADVVVVGTYLLHDPSPSGELRLDIALQDVASGETLDAFAVARPFGELLPLVDEAGVRLRETLGLAALSAREREELNASLPPTATAARLHAQGLIAMSRFNFTAARDLFQEEAQADPESPFAYAALADAWDWLGYESRGREASRLAFELSGMLSREAQLAIEEGYRERNGEWRRAVEVARALFEFYPDSIDYGLSLASVLAKTGNDQGAAHVISELRALPGPAAHDPRVDLAEAWLADANPVRKLDAADRAVAVAEAMGARRLVA